MSRDLQATQPVKSQNSDSRVAVLLAGYGEVQSYRALSIYNQAATKYIASQFVPIPEWLYPLDPSGEKPGHSRSASYSISTTRLGNR